jgi:hypothetical protein
MTMDSVNICNVMPCNLVQFAGLEECNSNNKPLQEASRKNEMDTYENRVWKDIS